MKGQMTHPDPDALAEFRAGLMTGRRRASITSHLAACERCAGPSGQLAEISALLAAMPPPAMPGDVARRLDPVLAAEAAKRDSPERTADDSPADRATVPRPRGPGITGWSPSGSCCPRPPSWCWPRAGTA